MYLPAVPWRFRQGKEGYHIRARVPKTNPNTFKQEWFFCYSFKVRIAEESLRFNITKGVIDRSFQIKAIKGKPIHYIKDVLNPASQIKRLKALLNDMNHLRKLLLCYRLIHFSDQQPDIDISGLDGREMELCKPLLQLFYGSNAHKEVKETALTFLDRKNRRKKSTAIEPILFELVLETIESKNDTMLVVDDIWREIRNKVKGEYLVSKPNEYQTYDYDTIYRPIISKTLEGFGAEQDRIHEGRVLIFNPRLMLKTAKQYDISKDAQDRLERIQHVTVEHPPKPTDTPSRGKNNENITKHMTGNEDTTNESEENKEKEGRDGVTVDLQDPPTDPLIRR